MFSKFLRVLALGTALSSLATVAVTAMSLRDATQLAIQSNPEIGQAIQNREATEFELRQALGLYAPRVDLEASTGAQLLSSPSRRAAGIDDSPLYPSQVAIVATFDLLDGGFRDSEVARQAARIDGASFRVLERSEFIALQIARVYYQVLLQQRIVALNQQNVAFHESMLQDVSSSIERGQLTEADRFQVVERMAAARARMTEAAVDLEAARIEFKLFVGMRPDTVTMPPRVGSALPRTLESAIEEARVNNPLVRVANADIDASAALVTQAQGARGPKVQIEARGATGFDIGGTEEVTNELSGRLSLRWNIFDGGIGDAQVQEQVRRQSEAIYAQDQTFREVEEAVRTSWLRLQTQGTLNATYGEQLDASAKLISAYREQFGVGDRSLLDVLDAQNTRVNVQILQETSAYGVKFAEYRLMAATGQLLSFMGLEAPRQAGGYARDAFNVETWDGSEPERKPLDLTSFVN